VLVSQGMVWIGLVLILSQKQFLQLHSFTVAETSVLRVSSVLRHLKITSVLLHARNFTIVVVLKYRPMLLYKNTS